ncbi:MAG TPA: hypothetical protein EYN67_15665 [Flavobacteriales bacterium]|nr:hypothetical protein [Flavobacteriales bacterium]
MPLLGREKVHHELEVGIKDRINTNLKGVYLSGLGNIIAGTPADEGVHRNSWFLSVGTPSGATTTSKSKTGANSIRQLAKMPAVVLGKKVFFTNSAPAIIILEVGGFPDPVKRGSYIKESKSYEKLSIGGFSKQAEKGWVRITLIAMANKIRSL